MNEHCIEWKGCVGPDGYGRLPGGSRKNGPNINPKLAHRWAYGMFYGSVPSGFFVMHTCDNPPCINPLHLRVGTHIDNMRDAASKGRLAAQKRSSCPQGHSLTPSRRQRVCRICAREAGRRYEDRNRDAINARRRARRCASR